MGSLNDLRGLRAGKMASSSPNRKAGGKAMDGGRDGSDEEDFDDDRLRELHC